MKTKLSKTAQWLIIAIISLLGFSSCNPDDELLMYGTLTADYHSENLTISEDGDAATATAEGIADEEE